MTVSTTVLSAFWGSLHGHGLLTAERINLIQAGDS